MRDRVIMERAGVVAVSYGLVLAAHVELPGAVPFGLFLLAIVVVASTLAAASESSRPAPARRAPRAVDRDGTVPGGDPALRRMTGGREPDRGRAIREIESSGLGAMRVSLRRLEGELHALEDQRLTDLARMNGGARREVR